MTLPATQSDLELLRQMLTERDEVAFTTLYRRYQAGVYRFALQMTGARATAEDVTQDVFMVLMREGHRFDPARGSLPAFLYGIARNTMLRRREQERRLIALDAAVNADSTGGGALIDLLAGPGDPHAQLNSKQTVERVRTAVLSLPERYREAVVLCDLHEMSYAEAAEVVGCAVGTIRSRLHRGRALLMEKLRSLDPKAEPLKTARCLA
jgi:RNA polymerase sigma-70 factor (ECF subfamily)